jgi:hypothetical protein
MFEHGNAHESVDRSKLAPQLREQGPEAEDPQRQEGEPKKIEKDRALAVGFPTRLRGLLLFLVGFGVAFVLISLRIAGGPMAVVSGGVGAIGLVGLIELISGYPFYKVAQKWDSMHGLVRFLLGLVIIVVSIATLILLLVVLMKL